VYVLLKKIGEMMGGGGFEGDGEGGGMLLIGIGAVLRQSWIGAGCEIRF
jgi:hypothetical protein